MNYEYYTIVLCWHALFYFLGSVWLKRNREERNREERNREERNKEEIVTFSCLKCKEIEK
jgi:hypothetical protein